MHNGGGEDDFYNDHDHALVDVDDNDDKAIHSSDGARLADCAVDTRRRHLSIPLLPL